MAFNLNQFNNEVLLDKNKLLHLTQKILNNLYKSSLEEDILSILTQEEEDYSQVYPETEDIYIEIAKSKIHKDLEFLFTFEMSVGERLFLSSLIIQLALRSPQFIIFYNTPSSLYRDIDTLITETEKIKESWYGYSSETGRGDFLEYASYIFESTDISENTKESVRFFAPYVAFGYFDAFHLTSRPFLEGSQVYSQEERPSIFIWIPSDPEFKLVVELVNPYTPIYPGEVDTKDEILKSEGFQIIQYDEFDVTDNPIEKAIEFYEYLIACSKERKESPKNRKGQNIRRISTQRVDMTEEQILEENQANYENEKYYEEVFETYNEVSNYLPDNPKLLLSLGRALLKNGNYSEAIEIFKQAIQMEPNFAFIYSDLGKAFLGLNEYNNAIDAINQAIHLFPNCADFYNQRAEIFFNLQRFNEALEDYEQAIRQFSEYSTAFYNKGILLFVLERYSESLSALEEAIRLDPYYLPAYKRKGDVLVKLNRHSEAMEAYNMYRITNVSSIT